MSPLGESAQAPAGPGQPAEDAGQGAAQGVVAQDVAAQGRATQDDELLRIR